MIGLLSRRPLTAWIFAAALVVRIGYIAASHQYEILREGTETTSTAQVLAFEGRYADPFKVPTGPTAHAAPGYPFFLYPIYRTFGRTRTAELIKEGLSTTIYCATLALIPAVALALGLPVLAGNIAGLTGALTPLYLYLETKGEWEAPYAAFGLSIALLITAGVWKRHARGIAETTGHAAARGVWWGLLILFTPVFLSVMLVWSGIEAWRGWRRLHFPVLRNALLVVAVAVSLQIPWTIRNWIVFHSFIWSRDNFGQEIFWGNHEGAYVDVRTNFEKGGFAELHPNNNVEVALYVRRIGELAFNREKAQMARQWIVTHPAAFFSLSARRVGEFWFPLTKIPSFHMLLWVISLLAFTGLWLIRRFRVAFVLMGSLWVVFPLPYYLAMASDRYLLPILWTLLLAGGVALAYAFGTPLAPTESGWSEVEG